MEKHETEILNFIVDHILNNVDAITISSGDAKFVIEKYLLQFGMDYSTVETITEQLQNLNKNVYIKSIENDINSYVSETLIPLFEDGIKADKVAVRNKETGAIHLISRKTYQSNSQLYVPLSAGWAKTNVIMVKNKNSGEEYAILLKNFDPNKHQRVGSYQKPEKKEKPKELEPSKAEQPKQKKDKKQKPIETPAGVSPAVRPIMVEPQLKTAKKTAFIKPKTSPEEPLKSPKFASGDTDYIQYIEPTPKDKLLNKTKPKKIKKPEYPDDVRNDVEYYTDIKNKDILPSDFNMDSRFVIPTQISDKSKNPFYYIKIIERLINTIGGETKRLSYFIKNIPAKYNFNASVSLFELLLLFVVTLPDDEYYKFVIYMDTFVSKNKKSNLTKEIWDAVKQERELIMKYLRIKYGMHFELVSGAWKVEEDMLDLGMDDSDVNIDKVSDIFLRISGGDVYDSLEEFAVSPTKNNVLYKLNKTKFNKFLKETKADKNKLAALAFKLFPLNSILENNIAVVFPDVIFDYYSLDLVFESENVNNLQFKYKKNKNNIIITVVINEAELELIRFKLKDTVIIELSEEFVKKIKEINEKIYKIN